MRQSDEEKLEHFWQKLRQSTEKMLLLDYDGTLAPFQINRDQAFPYPGVKDSLEKIQASGATRLIIISGRAIADLLPLLGMAEPPELWGSHGFERRLPDSTFKSPKINEKCLANLDKAYNWLAANNLADKGEKKPSAVAFHWRGLEQQKQQEFAEKVRLAWEPLTRNAELALHSFDGGLELRCTGFNKGDAVRQVLSECGPDPAVAFLGDDLTDEDGFRVLQGFGLSVLVRKTYRNTSADCWLQPPEDLLYFLHNWQKYSLS